VDTTTASKYDPAAVPPSGVPGVSRFLLGSSPTGITCDPARTALVCWRNLLAEAQQNAERLLPETKEIPLQRIVIDNGAYRLIERPAIRGQVTLKPTATGRFCSLGEDFAGSLIDRVMLGERISGGIRPEVLWNAARDFAESAQLDGSDCRNLSESCAIFLALQAGIHVSPLDLP
jgi:hypothetical protein